MKLSVAAYRASASNVNRRLSSLNGRPRPRASSSTHAMARSVSWGSSQVENEEEVIVPPAPPSAPPTPPTRFSRELSLVAEPPASLTAAAAAAITVPSENGAPEEEEEEDGGNKIEGEDGGEQKQRKIPPVRQPSRGTRGNQRWMKLRTTVQLSGAVSSAVKEKKPPLKREDSFLKRFSTRQIAEASETVDNDGESVGAGGARAGATGIRARVAARRRKRRRGGPGGFDEPLTVINPDENFYFGWLSLLTVCVLYNCWTLIVRQAFPELQKIAHALWVTTDIVSDLVFLSDIGVQFRTGYLEQGLMVYDSKKLAMHYVRSRAFVLDLACLLPLDIVQLWTSTSNPMIRFPRFFKVYRSYNYYYMVESRTLYPNVWRVVNLIHILLLLAHWFGCFFFLLSEAENFKGNWTYPEPKGDFATLTRKYLGSLYWSTLTLTTIGDLPTPDSDWHRPQLWSSDDGAAHVSRRGVKSRLLYLGSDRGYLFTIVSYLIGVFIFATIVGQVGNVITNRNASRLEFERLLDGAKLYMRQHKVPREMQRRVQRWYDYSWSRGRMQGGGDINSALGILPDKLKTELALHVNLNTLKKVSIFQECQPEFLHDLVLKMKAYIFTPGDLICRKGEVAREMFIIADGILQVISETGRVLTTMRAGDFFGEIGILNLDGLNKRTADVRSVGYSELFSLSREDVLTAMKDYPEAQEILQSLGRKRLMEAKLAAAGLKKDTDGDSIKESGGGGDPAAADERGGEHEGTRNRALQVMRRIKRDARELRNYLRRGINRDTLPREDSKQAESVRIEMEPLSPGSELSAQGPTISLREKDTSIRKLLWGKNKEISPLPTRELPSTKMGSRTKGILMRMQKITSQTEPPASDSASLRTPSPPMAGPGVVDERDREGDDEAEQQPLGAGLPLMQRLRLLKEKEERSQRTASTAAAVSMAATASSSSSSAGIPGALPSLPPPVAVEPRVPKEIVPAPAPPDEPIGAGLPLFQRLRMLKEREERERAEAERHQASAAAANAATSAVSAGKLSLAKAVLLKKLETLREEEKGDGVPGVTEGTTPPPKSPTPPPPPPRSPPAPTHKDVGSPAKICPLPPGTTDIHFPPSALKATEFKPEEYLADLLLGVKQVLQTRLEEIQGQFKSRLVTLEEEVKRKNLIIQRLEETLQRCEVYSESRGVIPQPPQSETSPPLHKDKEEDPPVVVSSPGEASFDEDDDYFDDEFEQASDVTHPGYVSHPRRSWPLLPPWSERHRVGVPQRAWESQAALVLDPEHLWRAEFPLEPRVPPLPPAWAGSSPDEDDQSSRDAFDDASGGDASSEDDGQDDLPPPPVPQGNQWEIQMLAEQLLNKRHHVTDADPTDSDSDSGREMQPMDEGEAVDEDEEGPRRRGRRKPVRKVRHRTDETTQRGGGRRGGGREMVVGMGGDGDGVGEEDEGGRGGGGGGGEGGGEGLFGVLQQLSPTERRELERLLAVATRRHLTRQLSLRTSDAAVPVPVRRRSVASCSAPANTTGPSMAVPLRRRAPNVAAAAPLPPPLPLPSASSAYLHAPPPTTCPSSVLLISPPTDDDSVSICIPEYEPLLGPKQ